MKEMGIEGSKKKMGSKSGQTSKGGSLGKKEREVLNLAKGNMGFEITSGATASETKSEAGKGK